MGNSSILLGASFGVRGKAGVFTIGIPGDFVGTEPEHRSPGCLFRDAVPLCNLQRSTAFTPWESVESGPLLDTAVAYYGVGTVHHGNDLASQDYP